MRGVQPFRFVATVLRLTVLLSIWRVSRATYCSSRSQYGNCYCTYGDYTATVDDDGDVVIPKEWTFVPEHAFYGCGSLRRVTFEEPSNVTSIQASAFRTSNYLLESVFLPSKLSSMDSYVFTHSGVDSVIFHCAGPAIAFSGYTFQSSGLNTVYVPAGPTGGTSYVTMQYSLECCPAGKYSSTGGNQAGCTTGECTSGCTGECAAGRYR